MSADTLFKVKVLKTVEEIVVISAVTSDEAMQKAVRLPDVFQATEVLWVDPFNGDMLE